LNITGEAGSGKTTFVRHILGSVRESCASLRPFLPVIINCLLVGSVNVAHADLAYAAVAALKEAVSLDSLPPAFKREKCKTIIEGGERRLREGGFRTASELMSWFKDLQDIAASNTQLIIVFDNLDQLGPNWVHELFSLSRALFLLLRCHILLVLRPTTHKFVLEKCG
jgi:Cdc6-like AAA superfamily ATPase